MDYLGGGGGAKGMLAPLSNYWGGGGWPPSSYAYVRYNVVVGKYDFALHG